MKKLFFQSSMPRSGSTLLQNILAQHPEFYTTPTSGLVDLLVRARNAYSFDPEFKAQDNKLMKSAFAGFCREGIKGYFEPLTKKPYVVDKSRGWISYYLWLSEMWDKDLKMVCTVRDLRAVFASMEKNFRRNPDKSKGLINWETGQCTTTLKRVDHWSNNTPVGPQIERIKEAIATGIAEKIHFIRFEDLTARPEQTMDELYKYLEVKPHKHDFLKIKQFTKENDEFHGDFGDHKIRPKVEPVEDYHFDLLGKEICGQIVTSYKWYYNHFRY